MGRRYFSRQLLETIFLEERDMLKEMEFVQDWMAESREEGREEGRTEQAREMALRVLERRFGTLPPWYGCRFCVPA